MGMDDDNVSELQQQFTSHIRDAFKLMASKDLPSMPWNERAADADYHYGTWQWGGQKVTHTPGSSQEADE